jgi:hypothetical protein
MEIHEARIQTKRQRSAMNAGRLHLQIDKVRRFTVRLSYGRTSMQTAGRQFEFGGFETQDNAFRSIICWVILVDLPFLERPFWADIPPIIKPFADQAILGVN